MFGVRHPFLRSLRLVVVIDETDRGVPCQELNCFLLNVPLDRILVTDISRAEHGKCLVFLLFREGLIKLI